MTRQKTMTIALFSSLAFNVAFVGIWLYHFLYVRPMLTGQQETQVAEQEPSLPPQYDRLQLAPEQRREMLAQYAGLRQKLDSTMREAHAARDEYFQLLGNPDADPQAMRAAEQKMAQHQERIRHMVTQHLGEMRKVLDEDQQREFGRLMRRGHGGQRKGGHLPRRETRPFGPRTRPGEDEQPAQPNDTL